MTEEARKVVAEALDRGDVEGVLALRAHGTAVGPHLFRNGDRLEDLALSPKYALPTVIRWMHQHAPDARIAAVLRGCEERALVELAKRHQVDLSKVEVLGLACTDEEARECGCVRSRPSRVVIGTAGDRGEARPARRELPPAEGGARLEFWRQQYSKCIKCYGCRDVCPVCACEECMMSEGDWVQGGSLPPTFATFFLIKAYHMADRCVECHECESACPVGIPLTEMYGRLVADVERRYHYVTGRSENDKPPLLTALMDAPILDAEEGGG
jgi:formate dehydrogenase subunit beta